MSQFGSFGISNRRMWVELGKCLGILIGLHNSGKTSLLGSNPAALVINLDISSTPSASPDAPPLAAQMWPGVDEKGRAINVDGSIIKPFNWAKVDELVDRLVEANKLDLPRPETVVFDSVTALFNMLRQHTLDHFKKDTWDEGRGDAMWEWLYQRLTEVITKLRSANYGVWFIAHCSYDLVEQNGTKVPKWSLNAPPGFFKRFYGLFEIALECQKSFKVVVTKTTKSVKVGDQTVEMPESREEKVPVYTVISEGADNSRLYKRRVALPPSITIPAQNSWALLSQEYIKVAKPSTPP